MKSADQLIRVVTDTIAKDPDIVFAYLFGSVVKGTSHSRSDVDVAVYFSPTVNDAVGTNSLVDRQIDLGLELERVLTRSVDVAVLNTATIDLRQNVLAHGRLLLCRDQRTLVEFKVTQLHRYQDFIMMEPIFRHYRRRRIKEGTFGGRSVNREEATGHH